jgi:hypothetical protein
MLLSFFSFSEIPFHAFLATKVKHPPCYFFLQGCSFWDVSLAIGVLDKFFRLISTICFFRLRRHILDEELKNIVENGAENDEENKTSHKLSSVDVQRKLQIPCLPAGRQITNPKQIPIPNDPKDFVSNFGFRALKFVCYLVLGIWDFLTNFLSISFLLLGLL